MIKVVSFNGGRGARNFFSNLLKKEGVHVTSIVNAYDDGKSTGVIRSFFRMLGPSDIRKVQEIMVPPAHQDYQGITAIFNFRYPEKANHDEVIADLKEFASSKKEELTGVLIKDAMIRESLRMLINEALIGIDLIEKAEGKKANFDDCSIMNLVYAGAFLFCRGDFEEATIYIDKLFRLQGTVLPTNNEDKKLLAIREHGTILYSEAEIVELRSNSRIKKIYLLDQYPDKDILSKMKIEDVEAYFEIMNRQITVTPRVSRSISDADIIVYSPGTQHSSLYPSYMTKGLTEAIAANKKALKVFVTNIGEDYETPSYIANDFIKGAIRYLRMGTDYDINVSDLISVALVNNSFSNKKIENYIMYDLPDLEKIGCKIILDKFEDVNNPGKHDGIFLSDYIIDLYEKSNSSKSYFEK